MLIAVTAVIAAPLGAWAGHVFTDVPDDHLFHDDIAAIAEAGVTRGCNPPQNTNYCPQDNVTRGQMAAFMNRLGALSGGTPVVNAATAQEAETIAGWQPDELVRVAYDTVDPTFLDEDPFILPAMLGMGTLATATIEAPRDGFLVINAHSETSNYTESDFAVCGIVIDNEWIAEGSVATLEHNRDAEVNGEPVTNDFDFGEDVLTETGVNLEEDCVSSTTIAVEAGTYEVDFEALFAFETTEWWNHALSVLYVPFDGQGNPPTEFSVPMLTMDQLPELEQALRSRVTR